MPRRNSQQARPVKTTLRVDGLKELDAQLAKLDKKVQIRFARSAMRFAAKPMMADAKSLVPYDLNDPDGPDGYHLRDYMRLQLEPKRSRKTEAEFRLGPARATSGNPLRAIFGGLGKTSKSPNYAQIVERESPYLRPAFDKNVNSFITRFKEQMTKKIERALR